VLATPLGYLRPKSAQSSLIPVALTPCVLPRISHGADFAADITAIGFPHVLNVKRAELLDKSSHYLVEHDFWNGHFLHSERATPSRQCVAGTAERAVDHPEAVLQRAQQNEKNAFDEAFYDKHDTGLLAAIEKKTMQDGLVQKKEMDMESQHQTDPHAFGHTTSEVRKLQDVGVAQAALEWMDARLVQVRNGQRPTQMTNIPRSTDKNAPPDRFASSRPTNRARR
jgi:hypothetical protein